MIYASGSVKEKAGKEREGGWQRGKAGEEGQRRGNRTGMDI